MIAAPGGIRSGRPGRGAPALTPDELKVLGPGAWELPSAETASELVPPRRRVKAGVACGREAATRSVGNCYSAEGIVRLARHLPRISFTAAQPFTR